MPTEDCWLQALFQSGSTRAFEKMTDEEYADYLSLLRKQFRAEIRDNHKRVYVTKVQKEKIQALLSDAIDEELNTSSHQV